MTNPCDNCSDCCKEVYFVLFGDDHVRWAKLHGIKVIKRFGRFWATFKVSCQKLKDNRCSIYDSRPEMCKEFKCEKFNGGKNGKDSST